MRKYIIIAFIFLGFKAAGKTYYVSNEGNDNNSGLGEGICEAWKTLSKVNTFSFADNDSILLQAGGRWIEMLIVPHSNLYFGRYGNGDNPVITGFRKQESFSQSGNVWTTTATHAVKILNTVLVNDKFAYKARYPNSGFLGAQGPLRSDIITAVLPNSDNYVGNEIVSRTQNWVLDVRKVKAQTSNTLTLDKKLTYTMVYQGGFFFQNEAKFIDSIGEFSFDSSNKALSVYSASQPEVKISTIDTLVLINHKDDVTIDNISFTGANMYTIKVDTSHGVTIKNCSIDYAGNFGIYGSKDRDIIIDNNDIKNCYNFGIFLGHQRVGTIGIIADTCKRARVINNKVKNIGKVAGMAANGLFPGDGERTHFAIYVAGDSSLIKNNHIDSSGSMAIKAHGRNDSICYNYITTFALVKCDVGGLQTQNTHIAADYNKGMVMYRNIIGNGVGYTHGIIAHNFAPGIYLDTEANGITIKENTIFNCRGSSVYFYVADSNIVVEGNNIEDSIDYPLLIIQSNGISLKGNVFYSRNPKKWIVSCARPNISSSDNNYFLRPSAPTNTLYYAGKVYSFPRLWVDSTGFDRNSKGDLLGIASNIGRLYINPTLKDSVINVSGTFVDAKGEIIINTFTLKPYTSKTLFPSYGIPMAINNQTKK